MKFDHQKFMDLYNAQYSALDGALDDNQASGIDALLGFLEQDTNIGDVRWAAYMLATVKEECANTWQPIEEYSRGQGQPYGDPVTVTDGNGNTYVNTYYGRGYVQLTWEANYQKMSQGLNLGDQLLYHPEQALDPSIAYDIMSFGMRNGSFTGVGLSDFINDSQTDYVDARQIVNGLDNAGTIAGYASTLESLLRQSSAGEGPGPRQYHIVNAPDGVNARKGPGSNFPVVHGVANNSPIDIVCQVHGQVVNGSNIWNKLADGTFVTDFYCDTPNFNKFSPPIPVCPQTAEISRVQLGPSTYQHRIVNAPNGVNARKGPGTGFPVVHNVANNSAIDITCQVHGQVVNGSDIWNQLADGTFVTDFYCDTPNYNKFSPPIPVCQNAPQPAPGQPGIKGDDYPFKDSPPDQEGGDPWAFYYRECTSFVAWRMNQLGVNFSNHMTGPNGTAGTFGNGDTWAANALAIGFSVDNTPSVGAIAHYDPNVSGAGGLGHVAYVAQVNGDGTIVIEEYNWFPAYGYSNPPRIIPASDVSNFIHIV
jgi:putative chitinase